MLTSFFAREFATARSLKPFLVPSFSMQRNFSTSRAAQRILPRFPLHETIKKNNLPLVNRILNETVESVNGMNSMGELPLVIAAEQRNERILRVLQEFGGCYLLADENGNNALDNVERTLTVDDLVKNPGEGHVPKGINLDDVTAVKEEAQRQKINGCGLAMEGCAKCLGKRESRNYSAEFKATVAYDSMRSNLSLKDLASKYDVPQWEIIKWRKQAREGLTSLFEQLKSKENRLSPLTKDEVMSKAKSAFREDDCIRYHDYIHKVLENGILDDPEAYMKAWQKKRGYTEEYRMPEDSVMAFFKDILYL